MCYSSFAIQHTHKILLPEATLQLQCAYFTAFPEGTILQCGSQWTRTFSCLLNPLAYKKVHFLPPVPLFWCKPAAQLMLKQRKKYLLSDCRSWYLYHYQTTRSQLMWWLDMEEVISSRSKFKKGQFKEKQYCHFTSLPHKCLEGVYKIFSVTHLSFKLHSRHTNTHMPPWSLDLSWTSGYPLVIWLVVIRDNVCCACVHAQHT